MYAERGFQILPYAAKEYAIRADKEAIILQFSPPNCFRDGIISFKA